ncbi:RluA family pseudouridine synthase [Nitrincola sp.]|uniref:RluA family pseudouridine synthase n=1 Tax=Nitrincola sp. TaxID=1926584 RepID=UPI003A937EF1
MTIELRHQVLPEEQGCDAASLLSRLSELPKQRIKDAMSKGAVVLKRKHSKRLRRASEKLLAGDQLLLSYDADILSRTLPEGTLCLEQRKSYSIWFKPAGVMSQGTAFGDHLALLRQVELQLNKPVFLVHRLDRETAGLMLIAHTKAAAATLSKLFQQQQINKVYQAWVAGQTPPQGEIVTPLDGKPASTRFKRLVYDEKLNQSHLEITIATGRTHQIRRHLAELGYPVMGDPRYGNNNKNTAGLQLKAVQLSFECLERKQQVSYTC